MSSHHDPVILINFKIFQFQPAWWFFWQMSFLVSSFHFTIFRVLKNFVNDFSLNGQFFYYLAIFQRKFTKFSTTILNEVPDDIILAIFRCDFVDIECWSRWNERFNIYFKLKHILKFKDFNKLCLKVNQRFKKRCSVYRLSIGISGWIRANTDW